MFDSKVVRCDKIVPNLNWKIHNNFKTQISVDTLFGSTSGQVDNGYIPAPETGEYLLPNHSHTNNSFLVYFVGNILSISFEVYYFCQALFCCYYSLAARPIYNFLCICSLSSTIHYFNYTLF